MTIFEYIKDYLQKTIVYAPRSKDYHIGLPNRYVTPCTGIYHGDQYYWDSYFIILGLIELGEVELAKGIVENFIYLYKRFAIIPMRNRWTNLGLSQPPYFTSMIEEVYKKTQDKKWLEKVIKVAGKELKDFWIGQKKLEKHVAYKGLSRYVDHYILDTTAEHESGWDMTSRFNSHCLDYLPIDLNCCLYKYETDLAKFYLELGNSKKSEYYFMKAEKRKKTIQELMWNEERGFYFDYNFRKHKQSDFYSLAGFYPLWVKIAAPDQAEKARFSLKVFEHEYGLAASQKEDLLKPYKQWDYPNGWPNLQWIVVKSLMNYGFNDDAKRIKDKWLQLNEKVFIDTGKLWEKYDVVKGTIGKSSREYKTQEGFGWTNMIYVKMKVL